MLSDLIRHQEILVCILAYTMCITFFHLESDATKPYKLIFVMNRDEYISRPTAALSWRDGLLGGWDMEQGREGGTWLAMDKTGRIGFLTNITTGGVVDPNAQGRGFLVVDWLKSEMSAEQYLTQLNEQDTLYNPFNLMLLTPDNSGYKVNRYTRGKTGHTECYGPVTNNSGTFGISNSPQHQPYKKAVWGQSELEP